MQVYLVGGAVRDALLGVPVKERDWVVVGGSREELLRLKYREVGRDFPVFLHPDTHEEYALARMARERLIERGRLDGQAMGTLNDGNEAGTGDLVRARLNTKIDADGQTLSNRDMIRIDEPDLARPYRAPFNVKFRGAEIPLPAVIGSVGPPRWGAPPSSGMTRSMPDEKEPMVTHPATPTLDTSPSASSRGQLRP